MSGPSPTEATIAAPACRPAAPTVGRAIVASDEGSVRSVLRALLTRVGLQVSQASTVAAALQSATAPADLVILDLDLPPGLTPDEAGWHGPARDETDGHRAVPDGDPPIDPASFGPAPKLGGLRACRALRLRRPFRHVPLVILAADANDAVRQTCLSAGASLILDRHFNPGMLLRVLAPVMPLDACGHTELIRMIDRDRGSIH